MIYAIIFVLLIVLELAYFRVARRFNVIDKPNMRSSHTSVALRGGGIIFLFGIWLWAAFFGISYPEFILGLTIIGIVSFIDDICSLPGSIRIVMQFATIFLMLHQLGIFNLHDRWMTLTASVICVGIINAYNFMDGINGITGGYSIAVLLPLISMNSSCKFISMPYLHITGLSLSVFCLFNFRNRAKCFAGDVGSISMAFILLFALGRLMIQTGDISYLIFLAVYGVDATMTICHRMLLRENLGQAHRKHAYQIMANELKIPHIAVSSFYTATQIVISFGLILLPVDHYLYMSIVIAALICAYVIFMKRNYRLHKDYLNSKQIRQ